MLCCEAGAPRARARLLTPTPYASLQANATKHQNELKSLREALVEGRENARAHKTTVCLLNTRPSRRESPRARVCSALLCALLCALAGRAVMRANPCPLHPAQIQGLQSELSDLGRNLASQAVEVDRRVHVKVETGLKKITVRPPALQDCPLRVGLPFTTASVCMA